MKFTKTLTVFVLITTSFSIVLAQTPATVKVGLMLPYSGTYASLGESITNGFNLYLTERQGKLADKTIEVIRLDDESQPAKATDNARKLVQRERVAALIGSVHSGVALAMSKVAKTGPTLMIIPNAGANALTREECAPHVFRSSFSNWQSAYALGKLISQRQVKRVVTLTWNYPAGNEMVAAFKESFEASGTKTLRDITLPFPNVDFQPLITEIATLKPDLLYVFLSGGGAVKFWQDYVGAGLHTRIPVVSNFLTDGTLEAMGASAEGVETTLHYADGLDNPIDKAFRLGYQKAYGKKPDVFAVQGYDAAQMLDIALKGANGDLQTKSTLMQGIQRLEQATIKSPRGDFTISASHNPVQPIYLRKVMQGENRVVSVIDKLLADPSTGCVMGR